MKNSDGLWGHAAQLIAVSEKLTDGKLSALGGDQGLVARGSDTSLIKGAVQQGQKMTHRLLVTW